MCTKVVSLLKTCRLSVFSQDACRHLVSRDEWPCERSPFATCRFTLCDTSLRIDRRVADLVRRLPIRCLSRGAEKVRHGGPTNATKRVAIFANTAPTGCEKRESESRIVKN